MPASPSPHDADRQRFIRRRGMLGFGVLVAVLWTPGFYRITQGHLTWADLATPGFWAMLALALVVFPVLAGRRWGAEMYDFARRRRDR